MKKALKWILGIILVLILVVLIGGFVMFGKFIIATNSIRELEPGLYEMEFNGDYGFDDFLKKGGATSDQAVAAYLASYLSGGFYKMDVSIETGDFGCSTICVTDNEGRSLFGRNYDWEEGATMLVHTRPKNGYESFSTCYLDFLGFGEDYNPLGSMMEKLQTLAAIYVPLDGMNEKGLMVADLIAGDQEVTNQSNGRCALTTTTAIRLLLDKASDVDEALMLLSKYDMHSSIGAAHHLSIADKSGKSVVVEYINNEMVVTETKIVTNHYLAQGDKNGIGSEQSHIRYDTLASSEEKPDERGVKNMLKSVAQMNYPQSDGSYEKTVWSIVYNPEGMCADFYFRENYNHSYGLILHEKGSFVKK